MAKFSDQESWRGGYYELAIEVFPPSSKVLEDLLGALWSSPTLDGCFESAEVEPSEQARFPPILLPEPGRLYGLATSPRKVQLPCGSLFIREDDGSDWLVFFIPMAGLAWAYDVGGYPFSPDRTQPEWQPEIDRWLFELAREMYQRVPYQTGLIGHEVSGEFYATQLASTGVPESRWFALVVPDGKTVRYFPATVW